MEFVKTVETDVIVVGAGLAGLYAAHHLAPEANVALLSKGTLSISNSMWAQGGIAAALAADDSPNFHLQDTLRAGRGLCGEQAVDVLVNEGPLDIRYLLELGVHFDRDEDGQLSLGLEGGHGRRRVAHANGLATGAVVTSSLTEIVLRQLQLSTSDHAVYEEMMAVELLVSEGRCVGVLALHLPTGEWWQLRAPATILACGGAAGLYARTTNPAITRGDGVALAYRAGATVADLEFVQFHPTALVPNPSPSTTGGREGAQKSFLLSEAIRGEGAHLLNAHGKRFMPQYNPRAELAPRDVVARAILREMELTGANHVLLDLSPIAPHIVRHHFAVLYDRCLSAGFDMLREPIPVAPAAHYVMGGVCTDLHGATTVPGLFACGEVACTGVQGANRLASNSLLECLVFGRRSALAALDHAKEEATVRSVLLSPSLLFATPNAKQQELAQQLGELLWNYAGLVRDADGLSHLLTHLAELETSTDYLSQNALLVARLIATAALMRTESRGGHYRTDFAQEDDSWRKRIAFQQGKAVRFMALGNEN